MLVVKITDHEEELFITELFITSEHIDISKVWNRRRFTDSTWLQRLGDRLRKFAWWLFGD